MASHVITTTHRRIPALRRGRVGASDAIVHRVLAITAVGGVGAAATSAAWGGAPRVGTRSRHSDGGPIAP